MLIFKRSFFSSGTTISCPQDSKHRAEVLRLGLEGTNPGISSNPLVAILINVRFEAEHPDLGSRCGYSPEIP